MANTYTTIKTNAGLALETAAQSGGDKITLTQMAIGDGGGNPVAPDAAQTALVREQVRVTLNAIAPNPDNAAQFTAEAIIPASAGGFTMREAGLYTADGTLFAVANLPQVYKPTSTEGAFGQVVVTMTFVAANATEVNLTVDENVSVATRLWVQNYVIPAHVFAGGTSGQLLAKSSNNDGAWTWVDPTASVHVLVDTVEEDQTLAANQTAITLSTVTANGLGVFINGVRLRDDEWSKVDDTHITLKQARNNGDRITLLQNEQTGYTDVLRADRNLSDVDDADTSIANLFGGAVSVDRSVKSLLAANTPSSDDNSKQLATTEFVHDVADPIADIIANPIEISGQTLNTLDDTQLANAIKVLGNAPVWSAAFAKLIGGYPNRFLVQDASSAGAFWLSTVANNLTTPGAAGASWTPFFAGLTPTPVATSGNGSLGVLSLYSANAGRMYAQTYNSDGTSSAKILAVADSTATSTAGKIGYTINGLTATPVEVSGTVSLKISNLYTAGSDGRLLADTYTSGGASITQTIALAASATKSSLGTLCFSINGVTGTGIEISGTSSLQVSRLYTAGSDSRLLADTYTSAGASVTRTIPYAASSSKSSTGVLGYTINGTVPTSLETTGTGALNVNYLYALGSTGRLWANTTNSAGTSVSKQIITSDQFTITDNGVSGYRITPDGSVEQWGIITLAASNQVTASGTITFPFNFPNRCRSICFTPLDPANSSTGCWPSAGSNGLPGKTSVTVSADTLSQGNSTPVVFNQSVRIMWEARGL